jgi:hypothetical protein
MAARPLGRLPAQSAVYLPQIPGQGGEVTVAMEVHTIIIILVGVASLLAAWLS